MIFRGSLNYLLRKKHERKNQPIATPACKTYGSLVTIRIFAPFPVWCRLLRHPGEGAVPFTIQQPNGPEISARNQGDEWNNWVETGEGYTIAQDNNGVWYYVSSFSAAPSAPRLNQGNTAPQQPVLTDVPASNSPPAGLPQHVHPTNQRPSINLNLAPANGSPISPLLNGGSNTTGVRNIVFILASFDDQAGNYQQPAWASFVSNNIGNYFGKASYGKVTVTPANESDSSLGNGAVDNNGVIGWINISPELKALEINLGLGDQTGNHPNTGGNTNQYNRLVAKAAMQAADPYIDYSQYDTDSNGDVTADELAVVVIVAGWEAAYNTPGSPSVWGHAWSWIPRRMARIPFWTGKRLATSKPALGRSVIPKDMPSLGRGTELAYPITKPRWV